MDSEKQKADIEKVADHLSRSAEVPKGILLPEAAVLDGLQDVLLAQLPGPVEICNSPGNLEDGMTGPGGESKLIRRPGQSIRTLIAQGAEQVSIKCWLSTLKSRKIPVIKTTKITNFLTSENKQE